MRGIPSLSISLTFQPIICLLHDLEQKYEGRTVVVRPVILTCSATKVLLLVVGCSFRCVDYIVFVPMTFLQEFRYLKQKQACLDIQIYHPLSKA